MIKIANPPLFRNNVCEKISKIMNDGDKPKISGNIDENNKIRQKIKSENISWNELTTGFNERKHDVIFDPNQCKVLLLYKFVNEVRRNWNYSDLYYEAKHSRGGILFNHICDTIAIIIKVE